MRAAGWFERLTQNPTIRQVRSLLVSGVPAAIAWQIPEPRPKGLDYAAPCRTCRFVRSRRNRAECQSRFLKGLEEAARSGEPVQFVCPIQRYAICLPVKRGGRVAGHLAFCHSEQAFPRNALELAAAAIGSAVLEVERSEELKNLSESIQPRCVALSTVHTIHRLISSTLNLAELMPRVARLCCQVLRAQDCAIWLLDREKQILQPRAAVQVQKGRGKVSVIRPCRLGAGVPGRVALTCKARLKERVMVVPLVEEECIGVIQVRQNASGRPFGTLDHEILTTLAEQAVVAIRNAQMYETQERVTWGTIRSLSAILDGMDTTSPGAVSSTKRMADVALAIAEEMRLPVPLQKSLQYAALLHDAGRLGIPQEILHKPSKLEPAEFDKVKQHTVRGASLLEPLEILEPAVPIILYHHERYDGTGYPKGLKREAIPLGARILAVANAFEAMVSDRPYRRAMTMESASREIASHSGTQFDPKVVEAFMHLVRSGGLGGLK